MVLLRQIAERSFVNWWDWFKSRHHIQEHFQFAPRAVSSVYITEKPFLEWTPRIVPHVLNRKRVTRTMVSCTMLWRPCVLRAYYVLKWLWTDVGRRFFVTTRRTPVAAAWFRNNRTTWGPQPGAVRGCASFYRSAALDTSSPARRRSNDSQVKCDVIWWRLLSASGKLISGTSVGLQGTEAVSSFQNRFKGWVNERLSRLV